MYIKNVHKHHSISRLLPNWGVHPCIEFEWDERKREILLRERRLDILDAALIFENDVLTRVDDRADYGEVRLISLGLVDGQPYTVVHTEKQGVTRLITAWKGGRNDLKRYQESIARRDQSDEGSGRTPD